MLLRINNRINVPYIGDGSSKKFAIINKYDMLHEEGMYYGAITNPVIANGIPVYGSINANGMGHADLFSAEYQNLPKAPNGTPIIDSRYSSTSSDFSFTIPLFIHEDDEMPPDVIHPIWPPVSGETNRFYDVFRLPDIPRYNKLKTDVDMYYITPNFNPIDPIRRVWTPQGEVEAGYQFDAFNEIKIETFQQNSDTYIRFNLIKDNYIVHTYEDFLAHDTYLEKDYVTLRHEFFFTYGGICVGERNYDYIVGNYSKKLGRFETYSYYWNHYNTEEKLAFWNLKFKAPYGFIYANLNMIYNTERVPLEGSKNYNYLYIHPISHFDGIGEGIPIIIPFKSKDEYNLAMTSIHSGTRTAAMSEWYDLYKNVHK